jgi:predicted Zn-dependent protease
MKDQPLDRRFRQYVAEYSLVRGDFVTAAKHFRVLLQSDPDNASLINNLAICSLNAKEVDALQLAERANKLVPNTPDYMDTLAVILGDRGEHARALETFAAALKIAPDNAAIRLTYARALGRAGKKAEARTELDALAKRTDKFAGKEQIAILLREL